MGDSLSSHRSRPFSLAEVMEGFGETPIRHPIQQGMGCTWDFRQGLISSTWRCSSTIQLFLPTLNRLKAYWSNMRRFLESNIWISDWWIKRARNFCPRVPYPFEIRWWGSSSERSRMDVELSTVGSTLIPGVHQRVQRKSMNWFMNSSWFPNEIWRI